MFTRPFWGSAASAQEYGGMQREGSEDNVNGASPSSGIKAVPIIQPRNEKVQQVNVQPDHLLVLVHGILASPSDWKYVENELKSQLGNKFLIHASAVNSFLNTLDGIDQAGRRLASEIDQIVEKVPSLERISFVAHSLGGLFARYAVALLYLTEDELPEEVGISEVLESRVEKLPLFRRHREPRIAGLVAVNFVTLASPHLGVRGKSQLPFLLGVPVLKKMAAPVPPSCVGRTGKQLFLTDGKPNDPPLLFRMASDCTEGLFISALRAFKSRAVYANVNHDHMMGWRTSSIRRECEISKPPRVSMYGYKHVVNVSFCPAVDSDAPNFQEESARGKAAAQVSPSSKKAATYHVRLEEEMVRGLQQVSWRKVDVSLHSALWPFLAQNAVTVKAEWIHYEGAGVIAHMADTLRKQEETVFFEASL